MTAPKQDLLSKLECLHLQFVNLSFFTLLLSTNRLTFLIAFPECLRLGRNPNRIISTWLPSVGNRIPRSSPLVSAASLEHTQPGQHPCCFQSTLSFHTIYNLQSFQSIITQDRMRVFLSHFNFKEHFPFKSFTLSSVFILRSTITSIPNASNASVACFESKDYHTVFFDSDRSMRSRAAHQGVKSAGIQPMFHLDHTLSFTIV